MGKTSSILKIYLLISNHPPSIYSLKNASLHYNIIYGKEKKKTLYQAQ